MLAGMCKNPRVDTDGPKVAELLAYVAAAVSRQAAAVSDDVYEVILREIPELRDDESVLALLASSVHSNIGTCLQIMQHQIDLSAVRAPAASLEYARRRAQRGTPLTALLRAYRLGHTCFSDWVLREWMPRLMIWCGWCQCDESRFRWVPGQVARREAHGRPAPMAAVPAEPQPDPGS